MHDPRCWEAVAVKAEPGVTTVSPAAGMHIVVRAPYSVLRPYMMHRANDGMAVSPFAWQAHL